MKMSSESRSEVSITDLPPTVPDEQPTPGSTDRSLILWATALGVWSTLYAVAHIYWASGGELGFSLLRPSATGMRAWREINAVASVVLLVPVALAVGLARARRPGRIKATLLLATLAGASIATSHGLYGIVYRILNLAGVVDIDGRAFASSEDPWVIWDLVLFEPWFLIEGILFGVAGWAALSTSRDRRRWQLACVAGSSLATGLGLLGLRFA